MHFGLWVHLGVRQVPVTLFVPLDPSIIQVAALSDSLTGFKPKQQYKQCVCTDKVIQNKITMKLEQKT